MNFFARQKASFWIFAAAAVFAVVAVILFGVSSGVQGYAVYGAGGYIFAGIAAAVLIAFGAYASGRFGNAVWTLLPLLAAVVLLALLFAGMLGSRVDVAATLFSYDSANVLALNAFTTGVVSMIFTFVAEIAVAVGAFFDFGRRD